MTCRENVATITNGNRTAAFLWVPLVLSGIEWDQVRSVEHDPMTVRHTACSASEVGSQRYNGSTTAL